MKTLTLQQPWASLAVSVDQQGMPFKGVETRSWKTGYRGPLAIHAGKKIPECLLMGMSDKKMDVFAYAGITGDASIMNLPYGAIVGTVSILDCVPIETLYGSALDTWQERCFGDWRQGRYGWILGDPVAFDTPVPARGKQGIWEWG